MWQRVITGQRGAVSEQWVVMLLHLSYLLCPGGFCQRNCVTQVCLRYTGEGTAVVRLRNTMRISMPERIMSIEL